MRWTTSLIAAVPLFCLGACHAVILAAQGLKGSPASVGFQVDPAVARDCITINPCQQDTTIIRDAEIVANVVNTCGRTELKGNIDVGENTESALTAGAVTQVNAGSEVTVTIHQVNADGAGPFFCDIDQTSNSGVNLQVSHERPKFKSRDIAQLTWQQNLTVLDNVPGTNGLSQAKAQAFDVRVKMPDNLKCTGGSTGNVCTVRCRNNAVAGPFGGCFPVQQADTEATKNTPGTINTEQPLTEVLDQVQVNQADFGKAVQANKEAGSNEAKQNLAAVNSLLRETVTTRTFAQETPSVLLGGNQPQVTNGGNRNGGDDGNKNEGNKNGGNKNGGNKNGGNKNGGNNNNGNNNGGNNNDGNNNGGNNNIGNGGNGGQGGRAGQGGPNGRGNGGGNVGNTNGADRNGNGQGPGGRAGAKKRRHQY